MNLGMRRVLIVEDDAEILHLLSVILAEPGREVLHARSRAEAESILAGAPVDLVVLDLILPDADGRALLTDLRARPETATEPVVVATARGGAQIRPECYSLGADAFVEKPFDPDVVAAGHYATDTVGEDMELIVRLHRHCRERMIPYRIHFVPDPVVWTECPESLRVLGRQRDRWQRGLSQSLTWHSRMLLRPRYGRAGMIAFSYFFFLEMLGPVIELLGYIAFTVTVIAGRADWSFVVAFLSVAIVFGGVLSLAAVALEELWFRRYPRVLDLVRLFGLALLENFGYSQLNAWWRLKGTVSALRGVQLWEHMARKGFDVETRERAT